MKISNEIKTTLLSALYEIESLINQLNSAPDITADMALNAYIHQAIKSTISCKANIADDNIETTLSSLNLVIENGIKLFRAVKELKGNNEDISEPLGKTIDILTIQHMALKSATYRERSTGAKKADTLLKYKQQIDRLINHNKERENEIFNYVNSVEGRLKEVEGEYQRFIGDMENTFHLNKTDILKKKKEMDTLFGVAAGTALAGGYAQRAAIEEKTANRLRNSAFALLLVIVGLFSWSLYETTLTKIDWHILLFKFAISIMLSVPATYLARESTKHRNEHKFYLSKSLDISAIDPYIATLPESEQHKLKSRIALRLFAARKEISDESNDLPINAHEIILKLIDKSEIKVETKADKNDIRLPNP